MSVNRLITLPHQRYVKNYKKKRRKKKNKKHSVRFSTPQ